MKKILLIASVAALASLASVAQAAGDATAGKAKSAACAGCHGADGNSMNPMWPTLAGQHPDYIAKQLAEFKSGVRVDPTMAGMAAPLSEQDMADLAAYFSSQQAKVGTTPEDKLEAGQTVYRAGNAASGVPACAACHGPNGAGNAQAKFPSLSGQHSTYVVKALKDFRSGARANDAGQMMRNIAVKMTDAEIDAVAAYVQGLH
jgi:cytochrome c553